MKNNQNNQKKGRGGVRQNSGRPKGSTNKLSPGRLIHDFRKQMGMSFTEFVNKKINDAEKAGDDQLVAKYLLGMTPYFVNNVQQVEQQVDHTTKGQPMNLVFPKKELSDWQTLPITISTKDDDNL